MSSMRAGMYASWHHGMDFVGCSRFFAPCGPVVGHPPANRSNRGSTPRGPADGPDDPAPEVSAEAADQDIDV